MFGKEIVVTVRRRDGRVETRRVVVDRKVGGDGGGDLVTLWAYRLIRCIFTPVSRGGFVSFTFVDLGGTSRSPKCIAETSGDFLGSGCVDRGSFIAFGSGSTPPTRTDFRLASELNRVAGYYYVDESVPSFTIAGYWTPDSDVTVCEVGLYVLACDSAGVARYVLFDRSVLDPCVSVGAGETISVAYTFRF